MSVRRQGNNIKMQGLGLGMPHHHPAGCRTQSGSCRKPGHTLGRGLGLGLGLGLGRAIAGLVGRVSVCGLVVAACIGGSNVSRAQDIAKDAALVLDQPAMFVKHPDRVFLETIAQAGRRLVAAGERGVVIVSDDDGVTWHQAAVPMIATITKLAFATPSIGWAVGHFGVVLRTDDAGGHWDRQLDGITSAHSRQAALLAAAPDPDPDIAAQRARSAQRLIDDGPDKPLFLIDVVSDQQVRVLGADGLAFETQDGGRSWSDWSSHLTNPTKVNLYGLVRRQEHMVVAGEQGLLMQGNPATRLTAVASPYDGSFFGLVDGQAAGLQAFGLLGHDFASHDGGLTWLSVRNESTQTLTAAVRLHDGKVLFSDLSGATFQLKDGSLKRLALTAGWPIADMMQTSGGTLILVGMGGVKRIPATDLAQALGGGNS